MEISEKIYQCLVGMGIVEKEADYECKDQGVIY